MPPEGDAISTVFESPFRPQSRSANPVRVSKFFLLCIFLNSVFFCFLV